MEAKAYNEDVAIRTMNPVHDATCSVAACAEIIGAKWTALLVHDLSEGARRFSELEHSCKGISPRTLSERLRWLEEAVKIMRGMLHGDEPSASGPRSLRRSRVRSSAPSTRRSRRSCRPFRWWVAEVTEVTAARRLQNVVQSEVNQGKRVEYQTDDSVTLSSGKNVNNVLHLILSIFIGPWAVVWMIFAFTGGVKRERYTVDETGNVNLAQLPGGTPTWAKVVSTVLAVIWLILIVTLFS